MNEITLYLILAGLLLLVFLGLLAYARLAGRRSAAAAAQGAEAGPTPSLVETGPPARPVKSKTSLTERQIAPSEHLVDVVDIVDERCFLTSNGCLIALFAMQPVLSTTSASPDVLAPNFAALVHALEPKTSLQIVQLPLPPVLGALSDRYARACWRWRSRVEQAQVQGDRLAEELAANRYFAAAQIGAQILDSGGRAPRRETFVVLSRSIGLSGKLTPEQMRKTAGALEMDGERLRALFETCGLPVTPLTAGEALHVLWNAYHPEQGALALLEQEQERFAALMQTEKAPPPAASLSTEQVRRALANPSQELRRLLAPPVLEECPASVRFRENEMLLYYANDFQTSLPPLRKLFGRDGRFAHRLYIAYFISAPAPDEMARLTRKASTAKQALQMMAARAGALPSYRQAEEVSAIEQARAGAETEKNVPRLVGLYLGLLVSGERAEADRMDFESILRSSGVELIPAQWLALDAWRTLLPLGQRFHRYEDRNLFSENLAPLNPVTASAWFEPEGEFCGFTAYGENAGMPVAIKRERGGELMPSDAVVGAQGSGKSYTLKLWISDWIARAERCFVVDPKLEFGPLTRALGGHTISLHGERGFNLLHFERIHAAPGSALKKPLTEMVFDDNLAALEALYSLAKAERGRATGVERNLLTNALKRAMQLKGLNPKNAANWKPNQVFLYDVYEVLTREMLDQDSKTVRMMAAVLEQYATKDGQYFEQYNTPNEFSLDADLIAATFGLAQLSADKKGRSITAHFALRLAVQQAVRAFLSAPNPIPFHIVIDEASQLLTTPVLVSSVAAMLSLLSSYGISVHLAFQDMQAIEQADQFAALEQGQSLNRLSAVIPAYWLFHQEPASAEAAVRLLRLPPEEARRIVANRVGQCLLAFPKIDLRLPLAVIVPEAFHELFRTDPTAMRGMIESSLSEPARTNSAGPRLEQPHD